MTTATTGDGVPELVAALQRHRESGAPSTRAARLARAEAQVWAVVADRLRADLRVGRRHEKSEAVLAAVADHRLDPSAAADRLLELLRAGG